MRHSSPTLAVGIDIGGTNVRCAVAAIDRPLELLAHVKAPTPDVDGPEALLDRVEAMLDACLAQVGGDRSDIAGVGCAVPGITDVATGTVLAVSNLRGWEHVPLAKRLAERLGAPAIVENDVNAAALGEFRHAGAGCRSLVFMTVSTGVAAGIVLDGRIWRGHHHAAGELGFMLPHREHIGKDWEGIGCLELTSAGIGLARAWAAQRGGPAWPGRAVEVFEAARAGDADARALVDRSADFLAMAAVAVSVILDPEVILLGGSIAEHQPRISDRIREVVAHTLPFPPAVRAAALPDDAPIVGALCLAQEAAGD